MHGSISSCCSKSDKVHNITANFYYKFDCEIFREMYHAERYHCDFPSPMSTINGNNVFINDFVIYFSSYYIWKYCWESSEIFYEGILI